MLRALAALHIEDLSGSGLSQFGIWRSLQLAQQILPLFLISTTLAVPIIGDCSDLTHSMW